MNKKIPVILLILASWTAVWSADWRSEVAGFFGQANDYRGAIAYLNAQFGSLPELDKPVASGLLSYAYAQISDKNNAYIWLADYFETGGGSLAFYDFLDFSSSAAVTGYLRKWQSLYPLVIETSFVDSRKPTDFSPPARLVIVVEMANDAFYKFADEQDVLEGGLFKRGFNAISLDAKNFFENSGTHRYRLELKADDLLIKKEIDIGVEVKTLTPATKPPPTPKNQEYTLSLYVGDTLLASSKKTLVLNPSLKMDLPPGKGRYAPYGPVNPTDRVDPLANSFSILSIPALINELIKELKKGKDSDRVPVILKKTQEMTMTLRRILPQGAGEDIKALVTLKSKNLSVSALAF